MPRAAGWWRHSAREFRTTCCCGLSKDYRWLSFEHKANCRRITVAAAGKVARLLKH